MPTDAPELPDLMTWPEWRKLNPGVSKLRYDLLVRKREKAKVEAKRAGEPAKPKAPKFQKAPAPANRTRT
ncbi:hypothetical protein J2W42_006555 [Rhizobium tibeticum]|uniref:hypothetical protein n=1 Tax=Rhizobium tibeticum TaxID=501024 RepID=UPI0027886BFF|nr:hypothetical protein [Rhizobium tibeticum]MDP9813680.1 hypothetical protein [Rhizobium tibeticum]